MTKGFMSKSGLRQRFDRVSTRPDKIAFSICLMDDGHFNPVMYTGPNAGAFRNTPDMKDMGHIKEPDTAQITVQRALDVFGENYESMIEQLNKLQSREELNEILALR